MTMMSVVVSMVISPFYFIEPVSGSDSFVDRALRILQCTFDLALRSSLSLEPFCSRSGRLQLA